MSSLRAGTAELSNTLDMVRDGIAQLNERTITESEFKRTLLQVALAFHSGDSSHLSWWVKYAGSIYNGITVIDDSTGGVLFNTPPMYTEASLTISCGLHAIISDAAHANSLNQSSDVIYQTALPKASVLEMAGGANQILNWYEIFNRYGYQMTPVTPAGEEEVAKTQEVDKVEESVSAWGDGDLA